jgi:hypothetical protein
LQLFGYPDDVSNLVVELASANVYDVGSHNLLFIPSV